MANRKVGTPKSAIEAALPLACSDEAAAVDFMEQQRWAGEPACPRCGDMDVYKMLGADGQRNTRFLWRCRGCKKQFTVRVGTIMEDSPIPLKHWCRAFYEACKSKKGISALELSRDCKLSYKSALFMMHRIRWAMAPANENEPKLTGIVEFDETYIGGKPRYPARMSSRPRYILRANRERESSELRTAQQPPTTSPLRGTAVVRYLA
jgi:transposase-like protein